MKTDGHAIIPVFLLLAAPGFATAESHSQRLFAGKISTEKNELNFQLADDEVTAVFTRAEADYSHGKIYLTTLDGDKLVGIKKVNFSDRRYKDSDPWLSPSGNELYFISDRPAFDGDVRKDRDDYDIWRSRRSGDVWLAPEHLESVNTDHGEFGPEINNGYLYFSSRRAGNYDIYRAPLTPDGIGNVETLPVPFNTDSSDSDFTLTKDGRVALWWSARPGGHGSGDLYVARLAEAGWTSPGNLGPEINTAHLDYTPSLSPNHAVLYFATNKPFPGQDKGAADLFRIAAKDVPALQSALSQNALARLKQAFGGEAILSSIERMSVDLETRSKKIGTKKKSLYADFSNSAIAEFYPEEDKTLFARGNNGIAVNAAGRTPMDPQDRERLIRGLTFNFLYYLTSPELELAGPFDIRGHGDLSWFRMGARGATSPVIGLDPVTGRIVKVLGSGGRQTLELDYLPTAGGLIWPFRFTVEKDGELLLDGFFTNMEINPAPPASAPAWFAE